MERDTQKKEDNVSREMLISLWEIDKFGDIQRQAIDVSMTVKSWRNR